MVVGFDRSLPDPAPGASNEAVNGARAEVLIEWRKALGGWARIFGRSFGP
jgi:hypothetical protein